MSKFKKPALKITNDFFNGADCFMKTTSIKPSVLLFNYCLLLMMKNVYDKVNTNFDILLSFSDDTNRVRAKAEIKKCLNFYIDNKLMETNSDIDKDDLLVLNMIVPESNYTMFYDTDFELAIKISKKYFSYYLFINSRYYDGVGSEVSYKQISKILGCSRDTIAKFNRISTEFQIYDIEKVDYSDRDDFGYKNRYILRRLEKDKIKDMSYDEVQQIIKGIK